MAANVQRAGQEPSSPRLVPSPSMNKDFQVRSTVILLALLTTAAIIYAGYNFQAERSFQLPTDGVWWVEQGGSLVANRVDEGGPGTRAGIKVGDQLTAIDEHPATTTAALSHQLFRVGAWSKTTYSLVRQAVPVDVVLIPVPAERSQYNWLRLIGLIYLGVGLYVLLRRWTALGSTHFYIFCLVSFIFYTFHYSGKLNQFDWTIYWGNVVAWMLQPALFLHFVL
ncbi:MAG: PDZ domain-containing protein, partial [Terriglobales bacterium]